jgi:catechol 2,3-dioxygenase-like lactoylglutathione lyase family enzyme
MAQIKHIAISSQDVDATARFYTEVMGLTEIAKIDSAGARGYYLSDGNINLAILNFKTDEAAGVERGREWSGLHHIGFEVESLAEIERKLAEADSTPREDINAALRLNMGGPRHQNVETKYRAPDGVTIDVSETGWVGTHGLEETPAIKA